MGIASQVFKDVLRLLNGLPDTDNPFVFIETVFELLVFPINIEFTTADSACEPIDELICGPFLSRIFMMLALRYISVALSSLVLFTSPVLAFILGAICFGNQPAPLEIVGCLVILMGIGLPLIEITRRPK